MDLTSKTTKHLIRVHYQGSTYQTRLVRTERFGPDLRTEPDHQKIKPRTGPEPSKFWNFKPRPDRIRINKIFKISDWFGPVGPLTWRPWIPVHKRAYSFWWQNRSVCFVKSVTWLPWVWLCCHEKIFLPHSVPIIIIFYVTAFAILSAYQHMSRDGESITWCDDITGDVKVGIKPLHEPKNINRIRYSLVFWLESR